jgi:hypothetical protein
MKSSQTPPPVNVCQSALPVYAFELSRGRTAKVLTRSLSPDMQVARLAIALLVQCLAVREPKEATAGCSYCREDGIAAAV